MYVWRRVHANFFVKLENDGASLRLRSLSVLARLSAMGVMWS